MQLQLATRQKVKLRMSISAPTGFGKTYGALLIAHGMTGDWSKICVIDTENNSASLYAHLGAYYTIPLAPPFTTDKYIQAIEVCEKGGMEVIIIDSVTHVWKGQGGLLEHNNNLGGRYQDWAKTTPLYQKWLNKILHSSCHVISTMRKKQAYALVQDGGKNKVEKKGMEDEIRDGFDFEQTIAFEVVNEKHMAFAAKDRTQLFDGKPEFLITEEMGEKIIAWCESGADVPPEISQEQRDELLALLQNSTLTGREYDAAADMIKVCDKKLLFDKLQTRFQQLQKPLKEKRAEEKIG